MHLRLISLGRSSPAIYLQQRRMYLHYKEIFHPLQNGPRGHKNARKLREKYCSALIGLPQLNYRSYKCTERS